MTARAASAAHHLRIITVEFRMRRGFGPDTCVKKVSVEVAQDIADDERDETALAAAEEKLRESSDYARYGKTWRLQSIYPD